MRNVLGRGLKQGEVTTIDRSIDRSLGAVGDVVVVRRLGALSERFESAGRGPGTVSSGRSDPGGVSYGTYQLASRTGTAVRFMLMEGQPWKAEFGDAIPGSDVFSRVWREVALREPDGFGAAQHGFIERTHYQPVVAKILDATGLDLDSQHPALRDATWSVSVQHGGAVRILKSAIVDVDKNLLRDSHGYDRKLLEAIYSKRSAYVLRVAGKSGWAARRTLRSIVKARYPEELKSALAMFESKPAQV